MPKKIRVYELAKELGLTNKEGLELALSLGIGVKSHSSSIEDAQADRVRRKADAEGLRRPVQPDEPAPTKAAKAQKVAKSAPATPAGTAPAAAARAGREEGRVRIEHRRPDRCPGQEGAGPQGGGPGRGSASGGSARPGRTRPHVAPGQQ